MDADESTRQELERGLDCYDPESRVFPGIAKKVGNGQSLTKLDMMLILKWKVNLVKGSFSKTVSDTNMDKINRAIRDAGEQGKELEAIENLLTIPEIKLAVATAILTVCFPHKFTILDRRVLGTLNLFPSGLASAKCTKHSTVDWTAKDYLNEYLPAVRDRKEQWRCSLRNADKTLWGLSVARQIEVVITNS